MIDWWLMYWLIDWLYTRWSTGWWGWGVPDPGGDVHEGERGGDAVPVPVLQPSLDHGADQPGIHIFIDIQCTLHLYTVYYTVGMQWTVCIFSLNLQCAVNIWKLLKNCLQIFLLLDPEQSLIQSIIQILMDLDIIKLYVPSMYVYFTSSR